MAEIIMPPGTARWRGIVIGTLAISALSFYGTVSRLFPSDEYLLVSLPVAAVIALRVAVLIIRADFRSHASSSPVRRVLRGLFYPLLAAVIAVVTVLALCVGVPGLLSEIAGT